VSHKDKPEFLLLNEICTYLCVLLIDIISSHSKNQSQLARPSLKESLSVL